MMKKIISFSLIVLAITACSNADLQSQLPDNRPDYKQSRSINPLEIPPDLTQSSLDDSLVVPELSGVDSANLSDYHKERGGQSNQRALEAALKNIHRSGDATWIELSDKPDVVFKNALNFWRSNGLPLKRVDKNIGILETDWLETQANLPRSGISRLLSAVVSGLKDTGTRDKFRTRIDYDGQKTYVYMTHYGATEEVITAQGKVKKHNGGGGSRSTQHYAWLASSRNPELEAEMLRRLNLYLLRSGRLSNKPVVSSANKQKGSMKLTQLADGTPAIVMSADFNQAWSLLGIAIDRAGYELSGQNRKGGTYEFAKITDTESGFILKEVTRQIEAYRISLADQGKQQIAVMRSHNNQPITAAEAQKVLTIISKEIQF